MSVYDESGNIEGYQPQILARERLRLVGHSLGEHLRFVGEAHALHPDECRRRLTLLCERARELRTEVAALQAHCARLECEKDALAERADDLDRRHDSLASLYVAADRLHASVVRGDGLRAIREILSTLVGTEEFTLCLRDTTSGELAPLIVQGETAGLYRVEELPEVAEVLRSGAPIRAARNGPAVAAPAGAPFVIIVPLKLGAQVIGAIIVWRLLPHKRALEATAIDVLDLLQRDAAPALLAAQALANMASESPESRVQQLTASVLARPRDA